MYVLYINILCYIIYVCVIYKYDVLYNVICYLTNMIHVFSLLLVLFSFCSLAGNLFCLL